MQKNLFNAYAAALLTGVALLSGCAGGGSTPPAPVTGQPAPNPYLSAPVYGVSHFNPAQTDAFPYAVKRGDFRTELSKLPIVYGGPINIMTLAATDTNYMWAISTDRVAYVKVSGGTWDKISEIGLPNVAQVSREALLKIVSTPCSTVAETEKLAKETLGEVPQNITANGLYTVADRDNNVYVNSGSSICVIGLKNAADPAAGLEVKRSLETRDIFRPMSLLGMPSAVRLIGMNMTYDGHLVIGAYNAVAVVDREFKNQPAVYNIEEGQLISNSLTVDDKNGIYIVSGSLENGHDGMLRKVIWTGHAISDRESDGAWSSPYDGGNWPPAIKAGTGSGSTPTLMGFEPGKDKLVVITDGVDRMKIVAFWRDDIPKDFKQIPGTKSRRIAGQMNITAGLPADSTWVQSEQSVVVDGWGAFVINNLISNGLPDKVIDVMAIGPVITPPRGVQRVEWDPATHQWHSVWERGDIVSTSMVPAVSSASGIVFVNGYTPEQGWNVTGLDWNTGEIATSIEFGQNNLGNGAYAIIQFLPGGDLLFNSIAGPIRVPLK